MNKIYILGGFGTPAGIDILQKLIKIFENSNRINSDSDYIKFCLDSHPSEYNHITDEECRLSLIEGIRRAKMHYKSCKNINKLILAIGCNTMHLSMYKYLESNKLPEYIHFVPIMDAVTKTLINSKEKIYLWSTKETYNKKIYHNIFKKYNLTIENNSNEILTLIEELMIMKKCNKNCDIITETLVNNFPCNSIIVLGCTDLPLEYNLIKKFSDKKNIRLVDCNYELALELNNINKLV